MIDYVKIEIPGKYWKRLFHNPVIDFEQPVNCKTAELISKYTGKYEAVEITAYPESGYIIITCSLHKLYNGGHHNFNDFNFSMCKQTIQSLCKKLQISAKDAVLRNVEVGVNVTPPIPTKKALNDLMCYKGKRFEQISLKGIKNMNYFEVATQRFYIKAYNKKHQYENKFPELIGDEEIFRYEIKYRKMHKLNTLNIYSLHDLTVHENWECMAALLCESWKHVILFDRSIRVEEIQPYQKNKKMLQWQNPNYWVNLNPQKRNKQKRLYNMIIQNHSDNHHKQVWNMIKKKCTLLCKKGDVLTGAEKNKKVMF